MQQWSPIYRIVVLLFPAFYCSWTAFRLALEATSSSSSSAGADSEETELQFIQAQLVVTNHDDDRPHIDGTDVADPTRVDCFAFNSRKWLDGPRMGNSNATCTGFTGTHYDCDPVVFTPSAPTPMDLLQSILQQQSLCRPESPFQSLLAATDTFSTTDTDTIRRLWTTRLLYLAVHLHQHGPALREAQHRRDHPQCQQQFDNANVQSFDYECLTAKFLVVSFYKNGIGANMRLAAVPALMAGLATARIVLFVNHAPAGPAFLKEPWTLASCPRRDAQCFFRPASPCVLTHDELSKAYQLTRGEMRRVFRHGELPPAHAQDRVLILHLSFRPQREPDNLRTVLYNLSQTVVEQILSGSTGESLLVSPMILGQAADAILVDDNSSDEPTTSTSNTTESIFSYYGANSPIFHSLVMYAMRPNPTATQEMNGILEEMFPRDYDAPKALGLPIRASDKCGVESECLSFAEHVAAAQALWATETASRDSSSSGKRTELDIVVTSESRQVVRERESYSASLLHNESFRGRFIVNHRDVAQDTGYLEDIIASTTSYSTKDNSGTATTADSIMLSALSSLQAQLQTRVTLGNCCSNFHLLLKDLMDEGCGATVVSRFHCLQDHHDPAYRVCCVWDKSARCLARRRQQQEQQQSNETLSLTAK